MEITAASLRATMELTKGFVASVLDASEWALIGFAAVVVAGLVGEYSQSERWKPWHRLFEILVIVGVAGELIADGGIFWSSATLQEIQDGELTAMRAETASANERATNATERTAGLEKEAAELRAQRADAEKQAAEFRKEAEAARLARAQIEAQMAGLAQAVQPRDLTEEQWVALAKDAARFAPMDVEIIVDTGDAEASELAGHLAAALTSEQSLGGAGWKLFPVIFSDSATRFGVTIRGADGENADRAAAMLRDRFNDAGIEAHALDTGPPLGTGMGRMGRPEQMPTGAHVVIHVCTKPLAGR